MNSVCVCTWNKLDLFYLYIWWDFYTDYGQEYFTSMPASTTVRRKRGSALRVKVGRIWPREFNVQRVCKETYPYTDAWMDVSCYNQQNTKLYPALFDNILRQFSAVECI